MSDFLIGAVAVVYLIAAVLQLKNGNTGMSMVLIGYAVANFGLIVAGAK